MCLPFQVSDKKNLIHHLVQVCVKIIHSPPFLCNEEGSKAFVNEPLVYSIRLSTAGNRDLTSQYDLL